MEAKDKKKDFSPAGWRAVHVEVRSTDLLVCVLIVHAYS